MRVSFLSLAAFVLPAFAFPSALLKGDISGEELQKITELAQKIAHTSRKRQAGLKVLDVGFDAEAQRVDTTGEHEYVCPAWARVVMSQLLTCHSDDQAPTISVVPAPA